MASYSLSHMSDTNLLHQLEECFSKERASTALLLAHIAEVETRKLFLPGGYSSMYAYCVQKFGLSEDSALKRIRAARAARRFPELFAAIADGLLNLNAVVLLAPHLTDESRRELIWQPWARPGSRSSN